MEKIEKLKIFFKEDDISFEKVVIEKINEIIDYLNSQDQPEENEPEKVYVDPIVPNFTEELSAPVEYKTKEEVKRMFEPEKKDWREELQDIINREMFKEDLMIQIKNLVEQELDKAREEGYNKAIRDIRSQTIIRTLIDKAREEGKMEVLEEMIKENGGNIIPSPEAIPTLMFRREIREYLNNKLSKLKTKEDGK